MNKPNNYDNTKAFSQYEPLPKGCYVCKIMQIVERQSSTGKPMAVISLDIVEGEHKDFYANAYKEDTREDKKWSCNVYMLTEDSEGNTAKNFRGFNDCVLESNPGTQLVWGEKYCDNFKGKLVGGRFGREEYPKQNGDTGWATKCFYFDTIDRVRSGKSKTPEDRPLNRNTGTSASPSYNGSMNIPDGIDAELPFH